MSFEFTKKVGKTTGNGQITVPVEYNSVLDELVRCPLGTSIPVTYCLPNGISFSGKLYQSDNKSTCYYQFFLSDRDNKKIFKAIMVRYRKIRLSFDPSSLKLLISPN